MDHHPGRFADHNDVIIFMKDTEGDGFGLTGNGFWGGNTAGNDISGLNPVAGFFDFVLDLNLSFPNEIGGHGTGTAGNLQSNHVIQTFSGMIIRNGKRKRTMERHHGGFIKLRRSPDQTGIQFPEESYLRLSAWMWKAL